MCPPTCCVAHGERLTKRDHCVPARQLGRKVTVFILEKYDAFLADEATPAKLENKTPRGKGKSPPRAFWRTFEPYASGRLRHPGAVDADHTGWGLISGNKCLDIITHLRLRQAGTGVEVVYQPMEAWGGKKHGRVAEGGRYLTEDFRGLASRGKS